MRHNMVYQSASPILNDELVDDLLHVRWAPEPAARRALLAG